MKNIEVLDKLQKEIFPVLINQLQEQNLTTSSVTDFSPQILYRINGQAGVFCMNFMTASPFIQKENIENAKVYLQELNDTTFREYIYSIIVEEQAIKIVINYELVDDSLESLCDNIFNKLGFTNKKEFLQIFGKFGMQEALDFEDNVIAVLSYNDTSTEVTFASRMKTYQVKFKRLKEFLKAHNNVFKPTDNKNSCFIFKANNRVCSIKFNLQNSIVTFSSSIPQNEDKPIQKDVVPDSINPELSEDEKLLNELGVNIKSEQTEEFRR